MNAEQLRTLAIALATQINATENARGGVADVGPDGICAIAIATAAQSFGTTRDCRLPTHCFKTNRWHVSDVCVVVWVGIVAPVPRCSAHRTG
jgi:hypothetical protein